MFSQQQLQQQLLQLQQLLQPQPQQASRGVTPSQRQPMLNLRAASQATLLNANPMLQRALLLQQMQGNLRGFNMAAAPVLQQFFPQATRHSLLGPPPVGVSLKPARPAFPGLPFQRQNRAFRKDFLRTPERKQEADSVLSSSQGQGAGEPVERSLLKEDSKHPISSSSDSLVESCPDGEPAAKRLRSEVEDEMPEGDGMSVQESEEPSVESCPEEADNGKENLSVDVSKEKNFLGELDTSEVVGSSGSLKVTIQQSSESRAISTTALKPPHWAAEMGAAENSPESSLKFYCYICKTNCCNQQNFQMHMAGIQHQQRLREIQHMSNICFVSLLPVVKEQWPLPEKDGESPQRWCNTCQLRFTGDLIKHRRTQEHKLAKRALRPFCTVCSRPFKTPRKFVEHMKSPEHKQKAKEVRLGEKDQGGPEDSEELITVDAVGCFEDDEEEEDEEEEEERGGGKEDFEKGQLDIEECLSPKVGLKETASENSSQNEEYCPDTVYGPDFLVPVAGFLCKLCRKFCHSDSAAQLAHCKSLMHFENYQRYKAAKLQVAAALLETSLCPQLDEPQASPPAARMEERSDRAERGQGAAKEAIPLRETLVSAVQRTNAGPTETDDICRAVVIEDKDEEKAPLAGPGGGVSWPSPGLYPQQEAFPLGTKYEVAGGAWADAASPQVTDQKLATELPSPARGETFMGQRRSARRKAR